MIVLQPEADFPELLYACTYRLSVSKCEILSCVAESPLFFEQPEMHLSR